MCMSLLSHIASPFSLCALSIARRTSRETAVEMQTAVADSVVRFVSVVARNIWSAHQNILQMYLHPVLLIIAAQFRSQIPPDKYLVSGCVSFCGVFSNNEETRPVMVDAVAPLSNIASTRDHSLNFFTALMTLANLELYLSNWTYFTEDVNVLLVEGMKLALDRAIDGLDWPPKSGTFYTHTTLCTVVINLCKSETKRRIMRTAGFAKILERAMVHQDEELRILATHALGVLENSPAALRRSNLRSSRRSLRRRARWLQCRHLELHAPQSGNNVNGSGNGRQRAKAIHDRLHNQFLVPFQSDRLPPHIHQITLEDLRLHPSQVVLEKQVSVGSFGTVFSAFMDKNGQTIPIALKCQSIPDCVTIYDDEIFKNLITELSLLQSFGESTPNIVRYYGGYVSCGSVCTASHLYVHGNLREYLHRHHLSWLSKIRIARDVANALRICHTSNILHRDIKTENILIDMDESASLCDFGFAIDVTSPARLETISGTEEFLAPEMLTKNDFGLPTDIFSFGLILCELISGRSVGENGFVVRSPETEYEVDERDVIHNVLEGCPPSLLHTTLQMIKTVPEARPTAHTLHSTFQSIFDQYLIASNSNVQTTTEITQQQQQQNNNDSETATTTANLKLQQARSMMFELGNDDEKVLVDIKKKQPLQHQNQGGYGYGDATSGVGEMDREPDWELL
eukprot:c5918_g1_i2.p1 GENE.c5918_g1_i2~~c5918_g1_i2.p1  ORF type:complete len:683 (+),score=160.00 c5918_g1_i2:182-2230(+)